MNTIVSLLVVLAVAVVFSLPPTVWAEPTTEAEFSWSQLAPETVFLRSGLAEQAVSLSLGIGWDASGWLWPPPLAEVFSLALEVEVGHWQTFRSHHAQAEFTQFGVTPMLRYPFADSGTCAWFVEGGVGVHFITPLYRKGNDRFSTSFNFQDLIGFGTRFGAQQRHELALYGSHFSNADIDTPNPGENFLQLRYLRYFD